MENFYVFKCVSEEGIEYFKYNIKNNFIPIQNTWYAKKTKITFFFQPPFAKYYN
jgi:hypothetical protein